MTLDGEARLISTVRQVGSEIDRLGDRIVAAVENRGSSPGAIRAALEQIMLEPAHLRVELAKELLEGTSMQVTAR